jgi:4-hydroxybenzoyl-CoA reductase subunit alpha
LTEDIQTRNGRIVNDNFRDYKLLLAEDVPEMTVIEVETHEPEGPYGAKEAGEGLTIPTAAAIANAIYNAVGVRIKDMPITPEKVLRALETKASEEREDSEQVVA